MTFHAAALGAAIALLAGAPAFAALPSTAALTAGPVMTLKGVHRHKPHSGDLRAALRPPHPARAARR